MIELKVVSTQKVIFEKEVEMAVLPGTEGDFAAMPGHSPFISSLRPGQMVIMANNKVEESFFVSGGLVMLKEKVCEVLVDQIISPAFLVALSIEVILAACSAAELSKMHP